MMSRPFSQEAEENIQHDDSPHKCHSIKAYNIKTFFTKGYKPIHQLFKMYNMASQVILDKGRAPKINFTLHE
jgi:Dullard-like phosphatase family protein